MQTRKLLNVAETSKRSNPVICLIVESGALIAIPKLVEFTLFELQAAFVNALRGFNAFYILNEIMPQITVSRVFTHCAMASILSFSALILHSYLYMLEGSGTYSRRLCGQQWLYT